jgi:3D (Asp-Asp-Asp) domain-containing protein
MLNKQIKKFLGYLANFTLILTASFIIISYYYKEPTNNSSNYKDTIIYDTVTATMYVAHPSQTDSTPNITADGTRINPNWAGKYRYLAVSRNLLEKNGGYLNYGDYITIQGVSGKYDGIWQVKDTMNKRWINRIDLLCNPGENLFKINNVIIKYYQ